MKRFSTFAVAVLCSTAVAMADHGNYGTNSSTCGCSTGSACCRDSQCDTGNCGLTSARNGRMNGYGVNGGLTSRYSSAYAPDNGYAPGEGCVDGQCSIGTRNGSGMDYRTGYGSNSGYGASEGCVDGQCRIGGSGRQDYRMRGYSTTDVGLGLDRGYDNIDRRDPRNDNRRLNYDRSGAGAHGADCANGMCPLPSDANYGAARPDFNRLDDSAYGPRLLDRNNRRPGDNGPGLPPHDLRYQSIGTQFDGVNSRRNNSVDPRFDRVNSRQNSLDSPYYNESGSSRNPRTVPGRGVAAPGPLTAGIRWESDVRTAVQASSQSGRPMLVTITADWCDSCQRMKADTLSDRNVVQHVNQCFVPVSVNADRNPELVQKLGITALPTSLVVGPDMRILQRLQGYQTPAQMQQLLTVACGDHPGFRRGAETLDGPKSVMLFDVALVNLTK